MWPLIIATVCAGLFAGAAIYIKAVEHPARLSCGSEIALREFAPSYHRATVMQAAERVYAVLSEGGQLFMPMQETFFASRLAMLRDKFGTSWMLLHPKAQSASAA